jgi:hypothetical protein
MIRRKVPLLMVGVLVGLALSSAMWVMPQPGHAGGVHVSIGLGIPQPVYIGPPPVVVQPAPVIIQPEPSYIYPGVVYPPPVVYTVPYGVYRRPWPPGLAKKHHGHHHGYDYKSYKYGKHEW